MTQRYGEQWAKDFATAHEQVPGNNADREAMDLYNNELGRRIATEHPDASPASWPTWSSRPSRDGDAVVIDHDGDLAFSDHVRAGPAPATPTTVPPPDQQPHPDDRQPLGGRVQPGWRPTTTSGTTTSGNR